MSKGDSDKRALEYILDLDGETMEVGEGYWVTFRFWRVAPDTNHPHGLRYALTLHSPGGRRLVGYDNAHLPEELQSKKQALRVEQPFDHVHFEGQRVRTYKFTSPGDLMEDFWKSVERKLKEEGVR